MTTDARPAKSPAAPARSVQSAPTDPPIYSEASTPEVAEEPEDDGGVRSKAGKEKNEGQAGA